MDCMLILRPQAAADDVCAQLGHDYNSLKSSPCDHYGGNGLCGASGALVAVADFMRKGGELDIRECAHTPPQASCLGRE